MSITTKNTKLICFALALSYASQSHGWQQSNGRYIWDFLSGAPWPTGYNQNTGKPDNLIYSYSEYPQEFFQRINNALPESYINEAFMTDDSGSNITLVEDGEVYVTFIHEGAGYKNAFGYFTFNKDNPPTSASQIRETIVFPNLSYPHMTNGHRLNLGFFPAGTSIGFFIAANGFSYYTGVKDTAVPYYYSLQNLNPEPTSALRQHNVLLYDDEVQEVIIGFEDLPRTWGDNDFNDAVFSVKSTPSTAIDASSITQIPDANDSDADGVLDNSDEFPNDYERAFSSYYPSSTDFVTLAFEDNWPETGDYDMNDLVVREQYRLTYNAAGEITGFILNGAIDARGASHHNGFAVRLMGISPAALKSSTLSIAGNSYEKLPESGQSDLVLILWQDSHRFTETGESGSCQHFNTVKSCTQFAPVEFSLDVRFNTAPQALTHSQLDFFIFRTDYRGREIHFADYAPTDRFDQTQFGKLDDTSDPATARYFRNQNNLPWALKIPTQWHYPREYIDVVWAYPDYEAWVESSGQQAGNWYNTSTRSTHFY